LQAIPFPERSGADRRGGALDHLLADHVSAVDADDLFVSVNAVINSFRLVDHIFILTDGGPDNASALLLFYIYEVAFRFWETAYGGDTHRRPVGASVAPRHRPVLLL
jgi:hypothetical protein